MDPTDRLLLAELQRDATQAYPALGETVGLSAGSTHERVRKLGERRVIRQTMVDVDPAAVGRNVLAFVLFEANAWIGDDRTREPLAALPEVIETHIIAGPASVLVEIRTLTTEERNFWCRWCGLQVPVRAGGNLPRRVSDAKDDAQRRLQERHVIVKAGAPQSIAHEVEVDLDGKAPEHLL